MDNKTYGYFDDENREYVITDPATPFPWINYLGNEDFFDPKETLLILLHTLIYSLALVFIKIFLLKRRKF